MPMSDNLTECTWPLQSQGPDIVTYSLSLLRIPIAIFASESLSEVSLASGDNSSPSNLNLARLSNSFGK